MSLTGINEQSIGSLIAEKIVDLANLSKKIHILDEISIYGTSAKDGSATLSFEWLDNDESVVLSDEILDFFQKIREMVIASKYEAVEQVCPHKDIYKNTIIRVLYRFRIWPEFGNYESFKRELVNH